MRRRSAWSVVAGALLVFACSTKSEQKSAPVTAADDAAVIEDAGALDAVVDAPVFDAALPESLERLSQTGLYDDISNKVVSRFAVEFTPAHTLWSDGAEKRRFIVLPPGTRIDTSDMSHWRFPVGTRFFKEFARDGKRLETRLIVRRADTQNAERDFWLGSFVWRDDESDADFVVAGKENLRGTDHDAPSQTRCLTCHVGEVGRILGFSALQLSKAGPTPTLGSLAAEGKLTDPPPAGVDYPVPGESSVANALGYLHANCGHCHNPSGSAWPDTQMVLRLETTERAVADTSLVKTTVGVPLQRWKKVPFTTRVVAGDPGASGLLERMKQRGSLDQMPPIATEHQDPTGVSLITNWIQNL